MEDRNGLATLRDRGITKSVDLILSPAKCPKCGFPLRAALALKWRKNGIITPAFVGGYMRIVGLDTSIQDNLFSQLEGQLGTSIEHILFEAQRNICNLLFSSYESRLKGIHTLKKLSLVKRFIVEGFAKVGVVSGMGSADIVEYVPGNNHLARVKNPYNVTLVAANTDGALEWMEGCPFRTEVEQVGENVYMINSIATSYKPAVSKRLGVEKLDVVPGNIDYKRCVLCHAPMKAASRFEWVDDEGTIIDKRSGGRIVMVDAFLLRTVLRELAKELGDEVYKLLAPAQCDWTMKQAALTGTAPKGSGLSGSGLEKALRDSLDEFPVFGYGNPVQARVVGSKVAVVIENPFQEEVIAGTLQGLCQAFSGHECGVTWRVTSKATVSYSIEQA